MADDTGLEKLLADDTDPVTLLADDTDLETLLADDTDLVTLLADDTGLFPGATYDVVYSTNNMFTVNSYSYFSLQLFLFCFFISSFLSFFSTCHGSTYSLPIV